MNSGSFGSGYMKHVVERFLESAKDKKIATLKMQFIDASHAFYVSDITGSTKSIFIDEAVVDEYTMVCRGGKVVKVDDGFASAPLIRSMEHGECFIRFLTDFGVRVETTPC